MAEVVMGGRAATVIGRVVRAADRREVSDRELLRRFAADGDQTAFASLVRRYTGLVLGVCRRALANDHDAEDACQAVFVLLARKAGTNRWRPSVANWLYAAARKVSRNARVAAGRRAKREGRAAIPEATTDLDRLTGREAFAVLDEELDRLPPRYREPLVLCYLQGLTRDEAATRLAVPPATLKSQLERARRRLAAALTRRDVVLGAGLLAAAATSPAGASPSRLINAIQRAVGGDASPAIAALAEGVAVNGFVKKAALGLVLAVAAAAVGFGIGEPRTTTAGPPPEKATPAEPAARGEKPAPAAEKATEDSTRTIRGRVLDPDGKPVAGAAIVNLPREGEVAVVGKTAADGTFKVTVPLKEPGSYLFPRAAGFATDQFLMPATNTPAEVTFKLVKDTPIRGRVLDTQGKPVAGATVTVRSIEGFAKDSLDGFLAGFQKRPGDGYPPSPRWRADLGSGDRTPPAGHPVYAATTDKDGRFAIEDVGSERVASLRLAGRGIATAEVVVLTRTGFDPAPYNRETLEKIKSPYSELGYHPMLYPPDTALVAEAEKPVRGVVTDAATGKPRAGVTVTLRDQHSHRLPSLSATTDAQGRYEIHGAKKANGYAVSVKRDAAAGYIGRTVKAADTPAYEPVTLDVPTRKGIVLTGRLLDDQTGDPLAGFVCVGVLVDNGAARLHPEFDSPDCYDFANAQADGVYRTIVPPGPVLLMAGVTPKEGKGPTESKYREIRIDPAHPEFFDKQISGFRSGANMVTAIQGQWCKVLTLKPDEAAVKFDVRFQRASRFAVKVRDADGKPLTGVTVAGHTARDWALPETVETDTCSVLELEHAKPRFLAFLDRKHKLVGTLTLKGDEKEPAVATLRPGGRIKGKLVDSSGKPIAGAGVLVQYAHRAADEIDRQVHGDLRFGTAVETDANGQFTIDLVIPGEPFNIYGRKKDKFLEPPDRGNKWTVKAGEAKDLGAIAVRGD